MHRHSRNLYSVALSSIILLLLTTFLPLSTTLIVPQEVPSILSLIYSNIPPIKKGTDSRLGFGFRLGEHADFQVLVELGPQKETKPLGDQDSSNNSFNKRQVDKEQQLAQLRKQMKLQWQQRQEQLQLEQKKQQQQQEQAERLHSNEENNVSWLQNWSQDINSNSKKSIAPKVGSKKIMPVPTMPAMNIQSLKQLQLLYKLATTEETTATQSTSTEQKNTVPFRVLPAKSKQEITKELMDVRLDDDV